MVKPLQYLLIYFYNVLLKQVQVILVLNMQILLNGQLALETFAHQVLLLSV